MAVYAEVHTGRSPCREFQLMGLVMQLGSGS